MRYRKLRIAWSVVWGILCLLLIALWVRSYWWNDIYSRETTTGRTITFGANQGSVYLFDGVIGPTSSHGWRLAKSEPSPPPMVFEWQWSARETLVKVPIWFLILCLAGFGFLPWIRRRYSLRTLLIGMTVAAIGLGLVVYLSR